MSKKGILNSINGFLNNHKGLLTGASLLASVSANKAIAQENSHTTSSLQDYAQTLQVENIQDNSHKAKAELFKSYVEKNGLKPSEIQDTLRALDSDCAYADKRTCAIAEIYQEAFDRHEDNIMMLQYKDMQNTSLSGRDKIEMIEDRSIELKNMYGEFNDYEYQQSPSTSSSTSPENENIQNMLSQSLNGEFDENQIAHGDMTYADLGGLAVYVSIQNKAREDVLDRGLLEHTKKIYEAEVEMDNFQKAKEAESKFKNPFAKDESNGYER